MLKELHWLPVEKRTLFKILVHTFSAIHVNAPSYIHDLVTIYEPTRQLRSANETRLVIYKTRTVTYGERSFRYAQTQARSSLTCEKCAISEPF